jgi:hypothetical protein
MTPERREELLVEWREFLREESSHAPETRQEPKDDQRKHPRDAKVRVSTETSGRRRAVHCAQKWPQASSFAVTGGTLLTRLAAWDAYVDAVNAHAREVLRT